MTEHVGVVVSRRAECGEGPFWNAPTNNAYWVNIFKREILRTDLHTVSASVVTCPEMVGAVAPKSFGEMVAEVASGFVGLDDAGRVTHRADCLEDGIRMNDAKPDPAGRYWSGNCAMDFRSGPGRVWRVDEEPEATLVLPGLTQPNGMSWSPDGSTFYLIEPQAKEMLSFPFEQATSTLVPTPTALAGSENLPGFPDGMADGRRGHLWGRSLPVPQRANSRRMACWCEILRPRPPSPHRTYSSGPSGTKYGSRRPSHSSARRSTRMPSRFSEGGRP